MKRRVYHDPERLSHDEAEEAFKSGSDQDIRNTMIQAALYDDDWKWVQKWCLEFALSDNNDITVIAATCLGHLARRFGELDAEKVVPVIRRLHDITEISGRVEDAIDDIVQFLGWDRSLFD